MARVCTASLEKAGYIWTRSVVPSPWLTSDWARPFREAMTTYERGLLRATETGRILLRGAADMHVGMAELSFERNDLDAARQHLLTSKEMVRARWP